GLQIGRDEKLDYSPINQLLKIKQGLELFADHSDDPAQEVANTLMGVSKKEVERDSKKIKLIDQYLEFIEDARNYAVVSATMERFEEALTILEGAQKARFSPGDLSLL